MPQDGQGSAHVSVRLKRAWSVTMTIAAHSKHRMAAHRVLAKMLARTLQPLDNRRSRYGRMQAGPHPCGQMRGGPQHACISLARVCGGRPAARSATSVTAAISVCARAGLRDDAASRAAWCINRTILSAERVILKQPACIFVHRHHTPACQ